MFEHIFYFACGGVVGICIAKILPTLSFSFPNLVLYATIGTLPFILKSLNAKKK